VAYRSPSLLPQVSQEQSDCFDLKPTSNQYPNQIICYSIYSVIQH
jgi:hypothetical protein